MALFCVQCGTEAQPLSNFCCQCGARLQLDAPSASTSSSSHPPPTRNSLSMLHMFITNNFCFTMVRCLIVSYSSNFISYASLKETPNARALFGQEEGRSSAFWSGSQETRKGRFHSYTVLYLLQSFFDDSFTVPNCSFMIHYFSFHLHM